MCNRVFLQQTGSRADIYLTLQELFSSFFFFSSRQFIWRSGSLHRSTLSCLSTMQQYFCGGTDPADPAHLFSLGSVSSLLCRHCHRRLIRDPAGAAKGKAARFKCCMRVCGWISPATSQLKTCVHAVHSARFQKKKTSEKSLFRCSNLPASPLLTFCFKLF